MDKAPFLKSTTGEEMAKKYADLADKYYHQSRSVDYDIDKYEGIQKIVNAMQEAKNIAIKDIKSQSDLKKLYDIQNALFSISNKGYIISRAEDYKVGDVLYSPNPYNGTIRKVKVKEIDPMRGIITTDRKVSENASSTKNSFSSFFLFREDGSIPGLDSFFEKQGIKTPTQKIEKPDFLNGRFNGKVYGNAKYGYRVYVDGKEKSITAEQKKQVDAWQKQESEKKETQKETQKSVTNLGNHLLDISLENPALDISNLASKAIKNPSNWEKYKKSDNVFSYPSNIALMEKNANTPEEKSIIERLKTDKDFADTVNKTYIQLVENKMKQMKDEQSTKQGYDNRQTQIDDYIKANGTPDIVKNGFWNGKVYGSEKSGYSVYIDGKKKTLSEADKKQFGLK
jgi:hypothetical protein